MVEHKYSFYNFYKNFVNLKQQTKLFVFKYFLLRITPLKLKKKKLKKKKFFYKHDINLSNIQFLKNIFYAVKIFKFYKNKSISIINV